MEESKCKCENNSVKMIVVLVVIIIAAFVTGFYVSRMISLNKVDQCGAVVSLDYDVNDIVKVENKFASEIVIDKLKDGGNIKSPYSVFGKVKGIWFFEASFPIEVTDLEGNILGQSYVQADGDWMTEDFVDFAGTIEFEKGDNKQGYFVFKNANPSDIREYDKEHKILVDFKWEF